MDFFGLHRQILPPFAESIFRKSAQIKGGLGETAGVSTNKLFGSLAYAGGGSGVQLPPNRKEIIVESSIREATLGSIYLLALR